MAGVSWHRDRRYVTLLAPPQGSLAINAAVAPLPPSQSARCPALPGGSGDDTWSSVRALRAARAVPARRVGRRRGARHARQPRLDPAARGPRHLALGVLLAGRGRHRVQAGVGPERLAPVALRGDGRTLP